MQTLLEKVSPTNPEPGAIARAADILRGGGLVAFPTETVYGLGASALSISAVRRIFDAKGRPSRNPVIVHLADTSRIHQLAANWPEAAHRLASEFWPGPLTLVVPRTEKVPDIVTAGGPTVALRIPSHPVALALIRALGEPIAAPSANRSTAISPTQASHVLKTLNGRIDMVLDAGSCPGGIESTVLSIREDGTAQIFRPGLVTPAEIEAVIGKGNLHRSPAGHTDEGTSPLAAPGMMERHYAPQATLHLAVGSGLEEAFRLAEQGYRTAWLSFGKPPSHDSQPASLLVRPMPIDPAAYAANLYSVLHEIDSIPVDYIVADSLPGTEDWNAVRDRLGRAAAPRDESTAEE